MDTHEQFRESERRTFPMRVAAVALVLAIGALLPSAHADLDSVGILAAVYAGYLGVVRLALLPRFRSDAWIYGMLLADASFAGAVMTVFSPIGPALALPAFMTGYYALFLGYRGAIAATAAGLVAVAAASFAGGSDIPLALTTVGPPLAAIAAISGYLATERFAERARRQQHVMGVSREARASRVLAALTPVASAASVQEWADAVATSLPAAAGFPAALVFLSAPGRQLPVLSANNLSGDSSSYETAARDAALGAMKSGVAEAISQDELPAWFRAGGYRSGVAAPLSSNGRIAGAVCIYSEKPGDPGPADLEQTELFLGLATRFLFALRDGAGIGVRNDRLTSELEDAGRGPGALTRPVLEVQGLRLDPNSERSSVGGVALPLSRAEFDLLYILAAAPGSVVSPESLMAETRRSPSGARSNAIDVTIHRLRRKLSKCSQGKDLIRTVRGKGYMLVPPGT